MTKPQPSKEEKRMEKLLRRDVDRLFDRTYVGREEAFDLCRRVVKREAARSRESALKEAEAAFPTWKDERTQVLSIAPWAIRKTIRALSRKKP